jgi:hypothetical protein
MNKIKFIQKKPFYIFEIDNFLDQDLYMGLKNNFPLVNNKNFMITAKNFKNGKFGFDTETDIYKEEVIKNPFVARLHSLIFSRDFFYFFYRQLYFKFLASRSSSLKHIVKLLRFPKFTNVINKKNLSYYLSIFTSIKTEIQYSLIENMGKIVPHTDSGEKLLSLMIYFPEYEDKDAKFFYKERDYGTVFWDSKEFNFNNVHQEGDLEKTFKKKNIPLIQSKFIGNKLIGFIKNPYSWHSVEPVNVHDGYIRKSININFYF